MKRSWSSAWRLAGSSSTTAMASPCSPTGRACSCSALARGTSASAAGSGVSRLGSTMCWPSQAAISARSCSALSAPASTSSWPSWRRGLLLFCCCCCSSSAARTCSGLTRPWLTSSCPRWRMGGWAASGGHRGSPGPCSSAHSACGLAGRAMPAARAGLGAEAGAGVGVGAELVSVMGSGEGAQGDPSMVSDGAVFVNRCAAAGAGPSSAANRSTWSALRWRWAYRGRVPARW